MPSKFETKDMIFKISISLVKSPAIDKCPSPINNERVTFNRSTLRPVMITEAPILEQAIAIACPIPADAPVTNNCLPSSENGLKV